MILFPRFPRFPFPLICATGLLLAGVLASPAAEPAPAGAPATPGTPKEATMQPSSATLLVYIGTYTGGKSKGIYRYRFDPATGALAADGLAAELTNPTFLALHPSKRFLYAANETNNFAGKPTGSVSALAIAPDTGQLTLLNQQSSGARGPCYVAVDPTGQCALVANYSGGAVAALAIGADGKLAEPACIIKHEGTGPDRKRQEAPHAHSINPDPTGKLAIAADLGIDKLLLYNLDPAKAALTPHDPPFATVAPGAGPRHLAFSPNGKFAYVVNEMGSTVTAFAYDAAKGTLSEIQTLSTLPAGYTGGHSAAHILVHPTGKFLYASNRGPDNIAIFTIDPATGKLAAAGHQPTGGKTPRNFALDPSGTFLIAANQDGNNLVEFRVDASTGALTPTGVTAEVGLPVCVVFVPR